MKILTPLKKLTELALDGQIWYLTHLRTVTPDMCPEGSETTAYFELSNDGGYTSGITYCESTKAFVITPDKNVPEKTAIKYINAIYA